MLDQRKRLGSNISKANLTSYRSKLPDPPTFLRKFNKNLDVVFGLMSIYSQINIYPIPTSTFLVSSKDSLNFHGTLFDHPCCSMAIDVNSALKSSVEQIFQGTKTKRTKLAEKIINHRKKKRIGNYEELELLVSKWKEKLDDSAYARIKF
jgi:hypothetical protein